MDEDQSYEIEKERRKKRFNQNIDKHVLQSKINTLLAMDTSKDEEKKYFKKFEKKKPITDPNPFTKDNI